MGRRRAVAVEADALTTEPPLIRRSSRLAEKGPVDYNEDRLFEKNQLLLSKLTATKRSKKVVSDVVKSGTKTIAPRKTKKDRETKLSRGGAVAVRIIEDQFTTSARSKTSALSDKTPTSSCTKTPVYSSVTVATAMPPIQNGVPITNTTPVSSRKHATKPRRGRPPRLATVEEGDQSMLPGIDTSFQTSSDDAHSGRLLKRTRAPAMITPDTTQVLDLEPVRRTPQKKQQKEKIESPVDVPEVRVREPRGVILFPHDDDNDDADATMLFEDNTMLEDMPETPAKRRKKETSVVRKKDKENTAAKKGGAVEEPAPTKKQPRRETLMLQRIVQEDERSVAEEYDRNDDAFANEFSREPGELDHSLSIIEQIEAGTLAIEDMAPEDRILAELFSPVKEETPRLNAALRKSRPLILSSSSMSDSNSRRSRGSHRAIRNLDDFFRSGESSDDESPLPPPTTQRKRKEMDADESYTKRNTKMAKNKYVRKLFSAAVGAGRKEAEEKRKAEAKRDAVSKFPKSILVMHRKVQYPGIAPLPVEAAETVNNQFRMLDGIM